MTTRSNAAAPGPTALLPAWAGIARPVIGMLHLRALPGSPGFGGSLDRVREALLHDADALASGGTHGLMLENFGDAPFYPARVPAIAVACMAALAADVRRRFDLPLGINILRNDGQSGLAVARAVGANYIRVNVLSGARVTDQGVLEGIAHELLRERVLLDATDIRIFADVNVKHAAPLGAPRPVADEVEDTIERGCADAVVTSGSGTGRPTDLDETRAARAAAQRHGRPVFIGSGITAATVRDYFDVADGFIVGTGLKVDGVPDNPVDPRRVRELMERVR